MYAIVNIAGQQFKVQEGQEIFVHRLGASEGEDVKFDQILMIGNGETVTVGTPTISASNVSATVVEHLKGNKVIVFKKNRRKGYKVKNGHRQYFSKIKINSITA